MQEYSRQFAREYLSELRWEPGLIESTDLFSSCLPSYLFASPLPLFILFSFYVYLLSSSSLVFRLPTLFPFSFFLSSFPLSSLLFSFLPFSFDPSFCFFLACHVSVSFSSLYILFSLLYILLPPLCLPLIPYLTFQVHSHLSFSSLPYFPFPSLSTSLILILSLSYPLTCFVPFLLPPSPLFLSRLLNVQYIHVQLDCNAKFCFSCLDSQNLGIQKLQPNACVLPRGSYHTFSSKEFVDLSNDCFLQSMLSYPLLTINKSLCIQVYPVTTIITSISLMPAC